MSLKVSVLFAVFAVISGQSSAETDITKGPPTHDKPWVPAWGWFGDNNKSGWKNRHEKMLNQTRDHKKDIKIVFFGDSKTEGWMTEGKDVWNEYYVKRGAFNYGIGGDSTRQVLWRIENGELDGLQPKILVFMIGGNNFGDNYNKGNLQEINFRMVKFSLGTDEEIVKAEHIIFNKIKEKLPKTHIIFVSQLPRSAGTDGRAKDINKLCAKEFPNDSLVHFFNPYEKFLNSEGHQNLKVYIGDHIHLNKQGYEILAENMEPLIKKYLQ